MPGKGSRPALPVRGRAACGLEANQTRIQLVRKSYNRIWCAGPEFAANQLRGAAKRSGSSSAATGASPNHLEHCDLRTSDRMFRTLRISQSLETAHQRAEHADF